MASRFFGYDPYCPYYYAGPYNYQRQPARTSKSMGIFAGAEPAAATKPARRKRNTKTSFSIPVHGPDSDPEPERKAAPAMSTEQAAVRIQAVTRGLLARKSVQAVCEVEREAEKMASETEVSLLAADPRARVAVEEALMRMLLRLDAVCGARDYRRRITKRVLALQDAVDALKTKPTPVIEMAKESVVAPQILDATERSSEMVAVHTATQMEFDGAVAGAGKPKAEAGEEAGEQKEVVVGPANVDIDKAEDSDTEGEWEMVTNAAPMVATSDEQEPPHKEPAHPFETMGTASAGAASDVVDVTKVMQMLTALCEQNAQQCAVIGAMAERVDALERTMRRMEDAGGPRSRARRASEATKLGVF